MMVKGNIDLFLFQWEYLEFIFLEILIDFSSKSHMAFVKIAEFDGLPGRPKG